MKAHFWAIGSNVMYLGPGCFGTEIIGPPTKQFDRNMRLDGIQITDERGYILFTSYRRWPTRVRTDEYMGQVLSELSFTEK